jgi:hypothetical protein
MVSTVTVAHFGQVMLAGVGISQLSTGRPRQRNRIQSLGL